MVLYQYTPSNFLCRHAVHLTRTTKQNEYLALLREVRETKTRISLTKGSDYILDTKNYPLG